MKHIQLMTGVHPVVYWMADFLCDAITMLVITACIGVVFAFDPFTTFNQLEVLGKSELQ